MSNSCSVRASTGALYLLLTHHTTHISEVNKPEPLHPVQSIMLLHVTLHVCICNGQPWLPEGGSYSRGPLSLTNPATDGASTDPHQSQHAPPGSEPKPVSALDEAEQQVTS